MVRTSHVRVLALAALLAAAGCQDYNFNPVGHCLISTATKRVTLSSISTADVLFVVDDSGSMGGEQSKLGQNFQAFIENLDKTNQERVANSLEPIDFHVAVTTTSVFYNKPAAAYCHAGCPGVTDGSLVCCKSSGGNYTAPLKTVQTCTGASDGSCDAGTCNFDCNSYEGEWVCCNTANHNIPALNQDVSCTTEGDPCGELQTHYSVTSTCDAGNAADGDYYPHGSFIGHDTNPRVLHFDKSLYTCASAPCINSQGFTADKLKDFFAVEKSATTWEGNVVAGTCGSGEEQALEAAKLAVQKALAATQLDTCDASGACTSTPTNVATWLHDDSKLVLVFVGDEDDCSSPQDASKGVILSGNPGTDSCVADAALTDGTQKEYSVASFVDYFTGLGKDLGAAFIVSTAQDSCQDDACTPGLCCDYACTGKAGVCSSDVCGGQGKGSRLLTAATQLEAAGADVVQGSICDGDFASILDRVAEIVKPPSGLLLPSQPASTEVTVLRIISIAGKTRKTCNGPAPATLTAADAAGQGYDWWFTASREQLTTDQLQPTAASRYVYINHATANCEASAGETYSADYIAQLPSGGCQSDDACVSLLGGSSGDWTCFVGVDAAGACVVPTSAAPGTCICGSSADNCPAG
jgi:hypothetical protein